MEYDNVEMISAEEFFGCDSGGSGIGLPDANAKSGMSVEESDFQDLKVKMVMKLEHCSRNQALEKIRERATERVAMKKPSN